VPFELWVQPWHARARRHHGYGTDMDFVRWSPTPVPHTTFPSTWAFLHYEYRTPSTWLVHPWLAYSYLSLAKLTALNFDYIRPNNLTQGVYDYFGDTPRNNEYKGILMDRLQPLLNMRRSKDLASLRQALVFCERHRESWFGANQGKVDIAAWKEWMP